MEAREGQTDKMVRTGTSCAAEWKNALNHIREADSPLEGLAGSHGPPNHQFQLVNSKLLSHQFELRLYIVLQPHLCFFSKPPSETEVTYICKQEKEKENGKHRHLQKE